MAGNELKLTQGELQERAGEITTIAGDIKGQLDAAKAKVEELLSGWVGEASTAFEGLWQEWQTAAGECHDNLIDIAKAMQGSGQAFEEQEDFITRGLNRMRQ